jgi:Fe-S oxidoreductase
MCNNNGACRKRDAAVMCPSYRVTGDEAHVTRGRANVLRLALSGQLGADALASEEMREALKLCVSCKGCKRECPTGVDMARMKIEVLHQQGKHNGFSLRDKVIGHLPRYGPWAARLAPLLNLRDRLPGAAAVSEKLLGFSARRRLPRWRRDAFKAPSATLGPESGREVVLFADCFGRYFEPEIPADALALLQQAGFRIHLPQAAQGGRPLCCGRSYLSVGMVDEARQEAERFSQALQPFVARGLPVLGLEPACLFTLRDELQALLPGARSRDIAARALLFEEFLAGEGRAELEALALKPLPQRRALLHGHCHQKAFGAMAAVEAVLGCIPELQVETIASSCCGMAGSFGYGAETYEASQAMGELSLLPAVRAADEATLIVADGTSCRHQIRDGSGRRARHVASLLRAALTATKGGADGPT